MVWKPGSPASELTIPYNNDTHLASSNYANDTVAWNLAFPDPMTSGMVPMPAYQFNITFYSDATLTMTRTNDTHTYEISNGLLDAVWVEQHEYWFDWQTMDLIQSLELTPLMRRIFQSPLPT